MQCSRTLPPVGRPAAHARLFAAVFAAIALHTAAVAQMSAGSSAQIETLLSSAATNLQNDQIDRSAEAIVEAAELLGRDGSLDDPAMRKRIRRLWVHIELTGHRLPPMRIGDVATSPTVDVSDAVPEDTAQPISFSLDIVPLLTQHCGGCHVDTDNYRSGFNINSMANLRDSGGIEPGDGDGSLIVRRMRGMDGTRMPGGGRPPVPESDIQLIARWIDADAVYDGKDPSITLSHLQRTAFVQTASPTAISDKRSEIARRQWTLAGQSGPPQMVQTDAFEVLGNRSPAELRPIADAAQEHLQAATRLFGGPGDQTFFPGRAIIFVFDRRYDFTEFSRMVQRRRLPPDVRSQWRYTGSEASVMVWVDADAAPETVASSLAAPVYSLAMASRGEVPTWMADGIGTAASMRRVKDRKLRQKTSADVAAAYQAMPSTEAFLSGEMSPQQTEAIAAAVASAMVQPRSRKMFTALIENLRAGQPFDRAFELAYNMPIARLIETLAGK